MKRYIVLASLLILSFLTGCSNPTSTNKVYSPPPQDSSSSEIPSNYSNPSEISPYSQGITISQNNLSLEQIAKMVFENQMQYVEEPNYPDESRIKDYKINTIKIDEIRDTGFVFSVDYSLLPATDKFVLAGNGITGQNGWINHKFHFVEVLNDNGIYRITSMATGR